MAWTKKRTELLREYWKTGLLTSEIAKKLGGFENSHDGGRGTVSTKIKKLRDAAKNELNEGEVKFWTRERPDSAFARSRKSTSFRDTGSLPHIEWPTDAEVDAEWRAQLASVK